MRPLARSVARTRQDRFSSRSRSFSNPRLFGSMLGDELKLSNGSASHVIGVSMKDRAAILPAGHHPNGAFWFNSTEGSIHHKHLLHQRASVLGYSIQRETAR